MTLARATENSLVDGRLTRSLIRWWQILVVGATIGALAGAILSLAASYRSEVLFRVDSSSTDSNRVKQAAQTALAVIDNQDIYSAAATALGMSPADLQSSTRVSWVTDTELVSVEVSARNADIASARTAAIAQAVRSNVDSIARAQFDAAATSSAQALRSGVLADPAAEASRRQAIGAAAATRQDAASASSLSLTQLGGVSTATRNGVGGPASVALGLIAGAAAGAAISTILGPYRGRIRRSKDLDHLASNVVRFDKRADLSKAILAISKLNAPFILVLRSASNRQSDATNYILQECRSEGFRPIELSAERLKPPEGHSGDEAQTVALGRTARAFEMERARADVLLLTGFLDNMAQIDRAVSRADLIVLQAQSGEIRFDELIEILSQAPDASVLVSVSK